MDNSLAQPDFGGFSLGAMQLALPMQSLREVVPCDALVELPCPAACVLGGISVRGVIVPVVDLRIVFGRDLTARPFHVVVLMAHAGRLLGLLADDVTGVFQTEPGSFKPARVSDATASIFAGGAIRSDTHTPVSVLAPEAVAALPQVPMVDDTGVGSAGGSEAASFEPDPPAVGAADEGAATAVTDERALPLAVMLLRCSNIALAVDAMVVHTTSPNPSIEPSTLSRGACLGTLCHDATRVPVIDLQALCGLGPLERDGPVQALIMMLPSGMVALLVSEVIDIVPAWPADIARVPAFSLPHRTLFAGALPTSALPDLPAKAHTDAGQYLMIDGAALKACDLVQSMASVNTSVGEAQAAVRTDLQGDRPKRSMITYLLAQEKASPMEQINEILPYAVATAHQRGEGSMLGFMVNRGRSIPVLCLARLIDESGVAPQHANVLVVESQGELIGFAVAELRAIADAEWEPTVPNFDAPTRDPGSRARKLAQVGMADDMRMLPVLDLQALARNLQTHP